MPVNGGEAASIYKTAAPLTLACWRCCRQTKTIHLYRFTLIILESTRIVLMSTAYCFGTQFKDINALCYKEIIQGVCLRMSIKFSFENLMNMSRNVLPRILFFFSCFVFGFSELLLLLLLLDSLLHHTLFPFLAVSDSILVDWTASGL